MYEFQKQFPSWNFLVPREELGISKGGKESFQRWKIKFPALEIYFSKAGKFLETCRGGSLLTK